MSKLERTAHIVLIVVALIAGSLMLERRFGPRPAARARDEAVWVGKRLAIPGARWDAHAITVVLYLSSECHFCNESLPFYRRLAEARVATGRQTGLTVLSMESIDRIERHLSSQKVSADAFYQVNKLSGLAGTPTILLVDADGVVIRALAGMLAADQEKQVLTIIRQGAI